MGLEDHVYSAETALPRRRQGGPNLRGMMSVIVDHGNTIGGTDPLKAAVHSVEHRQRFANSFYGNIQPDANRNRGGCIRDVVLAGNTQVKFAEIAALIAHAKAAEHRAVLLWGAVHIGNLEVRALAGAVCDEPPLHRGQELAQLVVIVA